MATVTRVLFSGGRSGRLARLIAALTALYPDRLLGLLLFGAGLYAYLYTLAPTVLEGDAALFQYTPHVLGVTYPTGYPLYILLGKLWLTLLPVGEIAWRMNLFSAVCSALALPLIYGAGRRLLAASPAAPGWPARWGALAAALTFATLPTFWRWSTEAKIYALNLLLFSALLYSLSRLLNNDSQNSNQDSAAARATPTPAARSLLPGLPLFRLSLLDRLRRSPLAGPALLLGLQLSVHSTTVLLIPGLLLFAWLHARRSLLNRRLAGLHAALLILPGLLYLYVPLRAEWLLARYGRPEAIGRGLLADFYHSGLGGLVRYFTAADFTGGVVTNWGLVPQQFFTVYGPLLLEDLTRLGAVLGLLGGLGLALIHPRRFWPLFLLYAAPIPFVLTYGQGEQSAFLLPSFLIVALFGGYAVRLAAAWLLRSMPRPAPLAAALPVVLLAGLAWGLYLPQTQHNLVWLTRKWDRSIYDQWTDALAHPLPAGAGMLAHWGDLTSFWYMQHAEARRPDLRGIYPPTEARVIDWYSRGHSDLFIAGPLQGWAAGLEERYRFIPWGRLVRLAPRSLPAEALLPTLAQPVETTFGDRLRLIGVEYAAQAPGGQDFPVTLTWQALTDLSPETTISLRMTQGDTIVAQLDEPLRSGWFPRKTLPAGQRALSYARLPVALGTLPGAHRLQLVVYTDARQPWTLPQGQVVLDLGPVEIVPPAASPPLPPGLKSPPSHDFNGEIELLGYDYSVSRVGQGKGFAVRLLWQTHRQPADNYTLQAEALDSEGRLLRRFSFAPVEGRAPTGSWQAGQFIRDQIDLVIPASAPPGPDALQIRLSWLRPDGSRLNLRRWGLPLADELALGRLEVTAKENRVFDRPEIEHPLEANLADKTRLLGYNWAAALTSETGPRLDQAACAATEAGCLIDLTLYWQGLSEMAQPYRVFVHLVDAEGRLVTQQDRPPGQRGKHPTTGWLPGEVVVHPVTLPLPPEIEPGQYWLRVGLYLPPDGPRLPLLDETGEISQPNGDFVAIGPLEIAGP